MKRVAFVLALLCAASVGAENLTEWKTPEGKLYFGDRPPPGSQAVKKVDKPIGKMALPEPPRVEPRDFTWRDESSCQEVKITNVKDAPSQGIARHTVVGTITHEGNLLVKNVKVCGPGGVCDDIRAGDPMVRGEQEEFHLNIEGVSSAQQIAVRVECTVREPA